MHKNGSTTLDGAVYTYDNAGNRTLKANQLNNVTEQYTYDPLYQLTQVTQGSTTTESYSYDVVGNRLSSLGVPSYSYNSSNELTSNSAATFTYAANGNTLTKADSTGTRNYTWDFENRLTSVALPGSGGTATFKYDPFGRRIQKAFTQNSTTTTTNYLYDGENVIEELDGNGNELARYSQSPEVVDRPLAEARSGTTAFYEQDGIDSVTSISSSTGALLNTYTYDAFGNLSASTGALGNPFQYAGRDFDTETGMRYYRARYYNPRSGRFISEDPIAFKGGANFYRYVRNEPVDSTDPTGLYQLKGFPPAQAAEMTDAINKLAAKLRETKCCLNPKLRDKILDLLQPGGSGGVTFVYSDHLPKTYGNEPCARENNFERVFNRVHISGIAMDHHLCACPLEGTILHELVHLTWGNILSSHEEQDAFDAATGCYGKNCARPAGFTNP